MDYNVFAREIHAWARSKGWWEPPLSFDEQVVLYHSEVSEALEHWRDGHDPATIFYGRVHDDGKEHIKPDGVPIELADLVIRVLDSAGYYEYDLNAISYRWVAFQGLSSFAEYLRYLHDAIAKARAPHPEALWNIIDHTHVICDTFKIDLGHAIEIKMAYNETRSHRHGGKRV